MSYLFPLETSTFAPTNRDSSQEPGYPQPAQEHRRRHSAQGGPALAPLFGFPSTTTPQQPLPPLRSLNRSAYPYTGPPPTQNHAQQPPSSFSNPPPPHVSNGILPFGYRHISERVHSPLHAVFTSLDEIGHDLDYANSHLRALLDMPAPNELLNQLPPSLSSSFPHTMASRSSGAAGSRRESSCPEESGRLNKRRKLDSDKAVSPPYKGFRYGRYGQVEPGALTMEIVSCDGGLYSDGSSYAAENILKNDNTVYCTKGNRCNIVLQHQGSTTFSLKELIIKAPGRNYSSPYVPYPHVVSFQHQPLPLTCHLLTYHCDIRVKEGIVFLAMSKDELLRTDQYQSMGIPTPTTSLFHHVNALRSRTARSARTGYPPTGSQRHDGNDNDNSVNDAPLEEIYNLALDGSDRRPSPAHADMEPMSNQPTFHVLTECSDDEDDDIPGRPGRDRDSRGMGWRGTAGLSPTPLRNRIRRRLPVYEEAAHLGAHLTWDVDRNYEDDDDDDYTELYDLGNATISSPDSPPDEAERVHPTTRPRLNRSRDRANSHNRNGESSSDFFRSATLFEGRNNDNSNTTTGQSTKNEPPSTLQRAEFHIEMDKNKCTILFDPPVTARYILLKMWNPRQDSAGNIDIQGVVAKGFAGPRYFPAMELR